MKQLAKRFHGLKIPFFSTFVVYFDLGTSNTRIAVKDKGVVFNEATYLGYNTRNKQYLFFGNEAKRIVGKTPDFIQIVRPIKNSILNDFDAEVSYLENAINSSIKPYFREYPLLKPPINAVAAVASNATEIEQRAVEEALEQSGCQTVTIIEKALATAAGCGQDVFSHSPAFVIDIGGGSVELSIISGGGIVSQKVLDAAGEHMDKIIANYFYLKHAVIIGESTAEELKKSLLRFEGDGKRQEVRGKSLETGLPKKVTVNTSDVLESLQSTFHQILDAAKEMLEQSQPEIADEIYSKGIFLSGKLATVHGLDSYLSNELKIQAILPPQAENATILGLMKLENSKSLIRLQ